MPLKPRTKQPDMGNDWQDSDWTADEVRARYTAESNIGFRTGARSHGICDGDLDCGTALRIAPQVLPATGMVFGRPSAPASHRLYVCDPVPATKAYRDPVTGDMLAEIRSDRHQTMLPPSVHPEGERLEWAAFEEPAAVNGSSLAKDVAALAACTLLAVHSPAPGRKLRHDFYLALAGGLLKGGMDDEQAVSLVSTVCAATGDDDPDDRTACVGSTRGKLDNGDSVKGFDKLRVMVDPKVVDAVVEWLGLEAAPASKFSPVNALVDMGEELELIRTKHGETFAAIPLNGHIEAVEINDDRFRNHLLREYRKRHGNVAPPSAVSQAINQLVAEAEQRPVRELEARTLRRDDTLHVNLGAGKQAILTPSGWRVVDDAESDVMFRRPAGQGVLPIPERGGSVMDLLPFVNATDEQFVLLVGYVVSVFSGGPYLFLVINGERGSAKSTATRIVTSLTDPCEASIQLPTDVRNLFVTVREHLVLPCENVTSIKGEISNALCSIATGTAYKHRKLGTDRSFVTFEGYGSVVMNGIEDFAKGNDLRQRSIILNLKRLKATKHEGTLRSEFEQARPRILGAIFDAVCMGMARDEQTTLQTDPRMLDPVRFVTAARACVAMARGDVREGVRSEPA